jgi:hypothetical protein
MDHSRFDDLIRTLTRACTRRSLTSLLSGLMTLPGAPGTAAKRKKGKKKKRKRAHTCKPESAAVACAGAPCDSVRSNRCGQAVTCRCPGGFNCLSNGTCALPCTGHSEDCANCGMGVFCTSANTEGLTHCVVESRCTDHQVCMTSTSECPRGTQCQDCGISEGRRCIPVSPCIGG